MQTMLKRIYYLDLKEVYSRWDLIIKKLVKQLFESPDIPRYIEMLKEQKLKDESEKRKLDRRREREIVGSSTLIRC